MLMLVGNWGDACRGIEVRGPEDLGDPLSAQFGCLEQEALFCLPLGADRQVRGCRLIALGSSNLARAAPKDVFRAALSQGGESLVLAHNHPSGRVAPTDADIALTGRMIRSGELLGLAVLDHLIVAGRSWRSLRESTKLWECQTLS